MYSLDVNNAVLIYYLIGRDSTSNDTGHRIHLSTSTPHMLTTTTTTAVTDTNAEVHDFPPSLFFCPALLLPPILNYHIVIPTITSFDCFQSVAFSRQSCARSPVSALICIIIKVKKSGFWPFSAS